MMHEAIETCELDENHRLALYYEMDPEPPNWDGQMPAALIEYRAHAGPRIDSWFNWTAGDLPDIEHVELAADEFRYHMLRRRGRGGDIDELLTRWLRIFYGAEAVVTGADGRDMLLVAPPSWVEMVGFTGPVSSDEGDAIRDYLNGEVYVVELQRRESWVSSHGETMETWENEDSIGDVHKPNLYLSGGAEKFAAEYFGWGREKVAA